MTIAASGCSTTSLDESVGAAATPHSADQRGPTSASIPASKSDTLLYASELKKWLVLIYSYPQGKQVGKLTGFPAPPAGVCVDPSGNVYVTTQGGPSGQSYIYEYAHGGSVPIKTLTDPGLANACAVDSTTGNLAVANAEGQSGSIGDVAVYQSAEGSPVLYSDPNMKMFFACSYDDRGNLFADGSLGDAIDELAQGAQALTEIQLSEDIDPGSIQWLSGELVIAGHVGAHNPQPIYDVTVSGSEGQVSSPILLESRDNRSATGDIQFWVHKNRIIGPGHSHGGANGLLEIWKFPEGGLPVKVIKPKIGRSFVGVATSALGN